MNSYTVSGAVEKIGALIEVNSTFKKQQLVIVTEDRYPQYLNTQLTQDNVDLLQNLKLGDKVELKINVRGRQWTDPKSGEVKYINSLEVWTLVILSEAPKEDIKTTLDESKDDLPF